jgi:hypothetical protein
MSLQYSLNNLNESIKEFQNIAKSQIFNLGKIRITILNPKNKKEQTTISLGLYFLRNKVDEMLKSKIKVKDFNTLHQNIKRFFQKFLDDNDLIDFDKGEDLFKKLLENMRISPLKLLFCDIFQAKINRKSFKEKCNELKDSINNFNSFKEMYKIFHCKFRNLDFLRKSFDEYQKVLNEGNLKLINDVPLANFRIFRSFFPLNNNSEYLIDIKNRSIIRIE